MENTLVYHKTLFKLSLFATEDEQKKTKKQNFLQEILLKHQLNCIIFCSKTIFYVMFWAFSATFTHMICLVGCELYIFKDKYINRGFFSFSLFKLKYLNALVVLANEQECQLDEWNFNWKFIIFENCEIVR